MRSRFPICCCSSPAGIARSCASTAGTPSRGSAEPSTTRPARPPTRWRGGPARFGFPRPLIDRPGGDLSFAGLKTAVLRARDRLTEDQGGLTEQDRADICAGFQAAVADVLAAKAAAVLDTQMGLTALAVAGGVAANATLRGRLERVAHNAGLPLLAPPLALCTDNAAMIAYAGLLSFEAGEISDMTLSARPRWPLDRMAAPLIGSGRKGAKA